ncbi:MAG: hypothetical protein FJ272_14590 [Planctomycetes bacterium]|nr:hypothetical protein [Planctomycetota bacterium]
MNTNPVQAEKRPNVVWQVAKCVLVGLVAGIGIGYCAVWMRYYEMGVTNAQFALFLVQGALCGVAVGVAVGLPPRDRKGLVTLGVMAAIVLVTELVNRFLLRP